MIFSWKQGFSLLLRFGFGLLLLIASIDKMMHPFEFAQAVENYRVVGRRYVVLGGCMASLFGSFYRSLFNSGPLDGCCHTHECPSHDSLSFHGCSGLHSSPGYSMRMFYSSGRGIVHRHLEDHAKWALRRSEHSSCVACKQPKKCTEEPW